MLLCVPPSSPVQTCDQPAHDIDDIEAQQLNERLSHLVTPDTNAVDKTDKLRKLPASPALTTSSHPAGGSTDVCETPRLKLQDSSRSNAYLPSLSLGPPLIPTNPNDNQQQDPEFVVPGTAIRDDNNQSVTATAPQRQASGLTATYPIINPNNLLASSTSQIGSESISAARSTVLTVPTMENQTINRPIYYGEECSRVGEHFSPTLDPSPVFCAYTYHAEDQIFTNDQNRVVFEFSRNDPWTFIGCVPRVPIHLVRVSHPYKYVPGGRLHYVTRPNSENTGIWTSSRILQPDVLKKQAPSGMKLRTAGETRSRTVYVKRMLRPKSLQSRERYYRARFSYDMNYEDPGWQAVELSEPRRLMRWFKNVPTDQKTWLTRRTKTFPQCIAIEEAESYQNRHVLYVNAKICDYDTEEFLAMFLIKTGEMERDLRRPYGDILFPKDPRTPQQSKPSVLTSGAQPATLSMSLTGFYQPKIKALVFITSRLSSNGPKPHHLMKSLAPGSDREILPTCPNQICPRSKTRYRNFMC